MNYLSTILSKIKSVNRFIIFNIMLIPYCYYNIFNQYFSDIFSSITMLVICIYIIMFYAYPFSITREDILKPKLKTRKFSISNKPIIIYLIVQFFSLLILGDTNATKISFHMLLALSFILSISYVRTPYIITKEKGIKLVLTKNKSKFYNFSEISSIYTKNKNTFINLKKDTYLRESERVISGRIRTDKLKENIKDNYVLENLV